MDALERLAESADTVSIGDFLAGLGQRGYGPILLVPALLEITPVGGIPGVPTFLAAIIITFAVQILIGHTHLWLPGFIERRRISSGKLCDATAKLRGTARFLDRWVHGGLPTLTRAPIPRIAAAIVILLACTVPPLELLPFASTAPMAAIAAFGLALLVRDGLLMAVAGVLAMAALGVGFGLVGVEIT
ncbi:exopolysaccharide biosynthesis protein [Stakelama tenebrarum]|uniref:Exopolysaccharide biosynthesis protein n=1 Tax=Stakelama tenebrarum TaxID=2711215 RepID=A0A6G6YBE5_9SPHN|nr:exopolysaccharide biosynthesis protein [Sphingosinithalassobacter tenebrarum]QIG81903.1 exopolysaccharide biosynthesis protein [Sphingosinithalassobacter tenebrarum]